MSHDHDREELKRYLSSDHGTLTVGELKEYLNDFADDKPVVFSYNYGDHARTTVAVAARGLETRTVAWSAYHSMPKVLDDDEEDCDADEPEEGEAPDYNWVECVVIDSQVR